MALVLALWSRHTLSPQHCVSARHCGVRTAIMSNVSCFAISTGILATAGLLGAHTTTTVSAW